MKQSANLCLNAFGIKIIKTIIKHYELFIKKIYRGGLYDVKCYTKKSLK